MPPVTGICRKKAVGPVRTCFVVSTSGRDEPDLVAPLPGTLPVAGGRAAGRRRRASPIRDRRLGREAGRRFLGHGRGSLGAAGDHVKAASGTLPRQLGRGAVY